MMVFDALLAESHLRFVELCRIKAPSLIMKPGPILIVTLMGIIMSAGCSSSDREAREAADRDYQRLSGTWQLTRAVVDGNPVPDQQLKDTILITDRNTFRFPQASGAGTHPAGTFTVNPSTVPKQVDSVASGGPNAGHDDHGGLGRRPIGDGYVEIALSDTQERH